MTLMQGSYTIEGAATDCQWRAKGYCHCDEPLPDSPRCYFQRIAVRGNRAIFQWDAAKRFPGYFRVFPDAPRLQIEGVEFADRAATAAFDVDRVAFTDAWEMFDTWEEAEAWLVR